MSNLLDLVVWHCFPPIPTRNFDYAVYIDGQEERGEHYGWGATIAEAQADFAGKLLDRVDDHIYDLEHAGLIDEATASACYWDVDHADVPR